MLRYLVNAPALVDYHWKATGPVIGYEDLLFFLDWVQLLRLFVGIKPLYIFYHSTLSIQPIKVGFSCGSSLLSRISATIDSVSPMTRTISNICTPWNVSAHSLTTVAAIRRIQ